MTVEMRTKDPLAEIDFLAPDFHCKLWFSPKLEYEKGRVKLARLFFVAGLAKGYELLLCAAPATQALGASLAKTARRAGAASTAAFCRPTRKPQTNPKRGAAKLRPLPNSATLRVAV